MMSLFSVHWFGFGIKGTLEYQDNGVFRYSTNFCINQDIKNLR